MKKFLSICACIMLACMSLIIVGCGGTHWEAPNNVAQNLPDKIHVEYDTYGEVFVKDGNEYFCKASNTHGGHRSPMYMKRELSQEVCVAEGYGGWNFITAILSGDEWVVADSWNENDNNQNTYTNAEHKTRTGYIDVNTILLDNVTLIKLANQTLNIGGNNVECVVWDYVYENDDVYGHHRYWYAADTGVFIKDMYTSDRNENIEEDGAVESVATYYAVGESMSTILAAKGYTVPDLSAYN